MKPAVVVVVATHNRRALLHRLVAALDAQRLDAPFEIVIVDDASTDGTYAELERLAGDGSRRVPLVPLRLDHNRGPAAARNAGWRASSAPLVAFTDDDCVPQPGWLASLVDELARADLVQGRTLPDPEQRVRHRGPFSRTLEVTSETGLYPTCNMGYRRSVLDRLDGFDEHFRHPAGEDTDLAWRARESGALSAYRDDAVVHHDVRPSSLRSQLSDTWRWEGIVLAVARHPGLRAHLFRNPFWKPSHAPALAAVLGMVAAVSPGSPLAARLGGAAVTLPYVHHRIRTAPLVPGRRAALRLLPAAFVADIAEVAVLTVASVRYRTLVL